MKRSRKTNSPSLRGNAYFGESSSIRTTPSFPSASRRVSDPGFYSTRETFHNFSRFRKLSSLTSAAKKRKEKCLGKGYLAGNRDIL